MDGGGRTKLASPSVFAGYRGDPSSPTADPAAPPRSAHRARHRPGGTGRRRPISAGIADVVIEAAVTTIMDCEDSVAAVDVADKIARLPQLARPDDRHARARRRQAGRHDHPAAAPGPRAHSIRPARPLRLRGRALMLVRNVGHLMTTDAVLDAARRRDPRGPARRDGHRARRQARPACGSPAERNSPRGSVYVVKPKMHGPAEVAFAADVFAQVEQVLGLPPNTVKIGLMDEERRTSVNLKECIRAARIPHRVHQHRLPRSHGRRDPHVVRARVRCSARAT